MQNWICKAQDLCLLLRFLFWMDEAHSTQFSKSASLVQYFNPLANSSRAFSCKIWSRTAWISEFPYEIKPYNSINLIGLIALSQLRMELINQSLEYELWETKKPSLNEKACLRTGRDSNPRPPPWQGGILTNWTTSPNYIIVL